MKKIAVALSSLALAGSPSCQSTTVDLPAAKQGVSRSTSHAVVADSREGGDKQVSIDLIPPKDGGFLTQAIVHRWVANDIFEYRVTLSANGNTLVTIPVMVKNAQSQAVFNHLKLGTKYTVSVLAMGNVGGTGAETIINSQTPASGVVTFSGENDVENTKTLTVQVILDNVVFDGSATVSIDQTDGQYTQPDAPETGSAL